MKPNVFCPNCKHWFNSDKSAKCPNCPAPKRDPRDLNKDGKVDKKDKKLARKLKELEANFLLLINTVGNKSHQKNKKKERNMEEEPRAVRPFEEVLNDVFDYILQSEDHDLILLVDELEKSAKEEEEKKEIWKKALRKSYKETKEFLKEQEEGEKGES